MAERWLGHIPQLILQVVDLVLSLDLFLQFLNDLAEEHINNESINRSLMVNVKHTPEILKRLWRFLVFHCQDEVEERFVVHFTFEGLEFFKNTVNENLS